VVNRTPLATTGSVLDILALYPEDFGVNVGGGGDDTAAFLALRNYIVANSISKVQIRLASWSDPVGSVRSL
jgi:hypothetical protein